MNSKILRLLAVVFIMLMSLCLVAGAESKVEISEGIPSDVGDIFLVTPTDVAAGKTVIFSCYHGGRLTYSEIRTYNGEKELYFIKRNTTPYDTVKVMVWESLANPKPVCYLKISNDTKYPASDYIMQLHRGTTNYDSLASGNKTLRIGTEFIKIEDTTTLYVNGEAFTSTLSNAVLDKFLGNAQGNIIFKKSENSSGKFDSIYVTYYEVGRIDAISCTSEKTTIRVTPVKDCYLSDAPTLAAPVIVEIENSALEAGETVLTVKKNGIESDLSALAADDVIAFATNFRGKYDIASVFTSPSHIDILATDEVIKGMVVDYDDEAGTYTVGNTAYKFVGYDYYSNSNLDITNTYELSLDPFGRILDSGIIIALVDKLAILEDIVNEEARLVLPDGSMATYEINNNKTTWTDYTNFKTIPVQDRVISYRLKNDMITFSKKDIDITFTEEPYNARLGKLADIELSENINIIDASKYVKESIPRISDYARFDASSFLAETKYTGYAYKSGDIASFIILTDTGYILTEESRFAVLTENIVNKLLDAEPVYGAKALYNGEETTLYWDLLPDLDAGDAIFFTLDGDGFVENYYLVYDVAVNKSNYANSTYAFKDISTALAGEYDTALWSLSGELPVPAGKDVALVEGVVMESDNDQILFGIPDESGVIDMTKRNVVGGYADFNLAADCAVYTFTKSDPYLLARERFNIAVGAHIGDSSAYFTKVAGQEDQYIYSAANAINAVALIVDGEIVCIYAIN